MRIVCVTHAYPRRDGDVPGAFVERLVVALANRGHVLGVVAPADGGNGGGEVRHGVHVERVRYAPAPWETLAYRGTMLAGARAPTGFVAFAGLVWQLARAARRLARRLDAELVHAHWWVPGGIAARIAQARGGPPYVVTLHGTDVTLLDRLAPARWLAARVLRRATRVTAVSSHLAERACRLTGVPEGSVAITPMPLDTSRFTRTSRGGGGIVTVGRLTRQKRLGLLIDALAHLATEGHAVPLTIVGEGPERAALEQRVRGRALTSWVRFVGTVAPERMADALGDADVFAFPAVGEGLGLAVAEALLLGIPVVVATDGGGVTDLVPPSGPGRLVPPTAPAFARAIRELLADPGARPAAVAAGAALRHRFDPDTVARDFETMYQGALAHTRERVTAA